MALKVHYRIHNSSPLVPIQSHTTRAYLYKYILILYKHLPLGLTSGLFPSGFPTNNLYTSPSPLLVTCPAHLILLYMEILVILGEEYKS
jgi:hypothetical protein